MKRERERVGWKERVIILREKKTEIGEIKVDRTE